MIKEEKGKFVLYSKDGKKKLGTFKSKSEARRREAQINALKNKDK